jgi:VCBS repeat-containing protein
LFFRADGGSATGIELRKLVTNDSPVAVDDTYSTAEDTALTPAAPGVLANDTDANGDPLTAVVVVGPAHGSLTLNANGSFTYTPAANYHGPDSFTYRARDGIIGPTGPVQSDTPATVNITVTSVNDAGPVAVDDTISTAEDTPLAANVLTNDTDADNDTLTATKLSDPTNGGVVFNTDGSFTYTPNANFSGSDSFTYKANDGTVDSSPATVNITVTAVDDSPVAVDDSASTAEDTPVTVNAPGVLANDTDVDSGSLTAGSASDPANGGVTLNADGSFTYTPDANFNGADSFTYTASDGTSASNLATVNVTVSPVNDNPDAVDDAYSTTAGVPVTASAPGVLGNDTDIDGNSLTAGSASDPANGSVTLNADGSFTYTADSPGFSGADSFTYEASDGAGGTDTATVNITISPDPAATTLSVSNVNVAEGNAGSTAANFTVTRSGNASGASTVKYKTSGGTATAGTDYTGVPALTTVAFAAFETTKTVTIDVTGDDSAEADETFNLVLSAPTGATLADASGTATIVNDDGTAYISVGNVTVTEGNVGTTPAAFTLTRSGNTNDTSTVKYKTGGGSATAGSDYTGVALTTVTFGPGEATKTVNVDVISDSTDEANENLSLTLSAPTGATLADAGGVGYITDDDGVTTTQAASTFLAVDSITLDEGTGGTTAATLTVTRTGNTSTASSVKYKTTNGTATAGDDYTAAALTTLNFTAGQMTQTVTVDVTGDTAPESNETFNLVLSAPTGAVLADATGTVTVVNDDGAAFLSVNDISVTEGNTGTTAATFTVTRSGNTSAASTVKYKTTNGTAGAADFTAVGLTTVSFAAGQTTATVTIDITGDTLNEVNEKFTVVLSAATGATIADVSGTATIVDDD